MTKLFSLRRATDRQLSDLASDTDNYVGLIDDNLQSDVAMGNYVAFFKDDNGDLLNDIIARLNANHGEIDDPELKAALEQYKDARWGSLDLESFSHRETLVMMADADKLIGLYYGDSHVGFLVRGYESLLPMLPTQPVTKVAFSLIPKNADQAGMAKWMERQSTADYDCFLKLRELVEKLGIVLPSVRFFDGGEIRELYNEAELLIRQREAICENLLRAVNGLEPVAVPEE